MPRTVNRLPKEAAFLQLGPGKVLLGEGPFTSAPVPPEFGNAFYCNDFYLSDPNPWKVPAAFSILADLPPWQKLEPPEIAWHPPLRDPFTKAFETIVRAFDNGAKVEKLVPVVTETGLLRSGDLRALAQRALAQGGLHTHSYGRWDENSGFIGATPEQFLRVRDRRLETMALAGTSAPQDGERFRTDSKQIREHGLVVQGIRDVLGPNVEEDPREILQLDGVLHFLTRLRQEIEQRADLNTFIRQLHPTPAVGYLPRSKTVSALSQRIRNQLMAPSNFAAPFGCWFEGRFESVVAIRHVSWQEDRVALPSGCGLIRESDPELEWSELAFKRRLVKKFLSL